MCRRQTHFKGSLSTSNILYKQTDRESDGQTDRHTDKPAICDSVYLKQTGIISVTTTLRRLGGQHNHHIFLKILEMIFKAIKYCLVNSLYLSFKLWIPVFSELISLRKRTLYKDIGTVPLSLYKFLFFLKEINKV